MTPSITLLYLVVLLLCFCASPVRTDGTTLEDDEANKKATASAALFEPVEALFVSAPSRFPKPTRKFKKDADTVQVIAQPTFGRHRANVDAVFAYAEGYQLPYYMMFMETLAATGFTGDVVLAIAEERIIKDHIVDYLKTFVVAQEGDDTTSSKPSVVVYQYPLECEADDGRRTVTPHGITDSAYITSQQILYLLLFR